jgi:fructuronate reductase
MVHIGLGAFHRAHQAWYTAHSNDARDWGIAAFTGRTPLVAKRLAEQDGLYTLIERGPDQDRATLVGSVSRAYDGSNFEVFLPLIASAQTALVTLTVTEAGYHLDSTGSINWSDSSVQADLRALRFRASEKGHGSSIRLATPLARLLLGLTVRRHRMNGPIAVVPCDNIAANGCVVRQALLALAAEIDVGLAGWIERNVSFVSTMVDRITPRTTSEDEEIAARMIGYSDLVPVVTEPFSEWVLCGDFPSGRPEWESAGAQFVADVLPFERRKLWMLNGAHSLLAYLGTLLGHTTIASAIQDRECLTAVHQLWQEAGHGLPTSLGAVGYEKALLSRFSNTRINHRLAQVGMDGSSKLRVRVVPIAAMERAAGRPAGGCATVIAAWVANACRRQLPPDANGTAIDRMIIEGVKESTAGLVGLLSEPLARDEAFVSDVCNRASVYVGMRSIESHESPLTK